MESISIAKSLAYQHGYVLVPGQGTYHVAANAANAADTTEIDFEGGFDFGWGGFLEFNGNVEHVITSDVWWGGSDWNNGAVWRTYGL